jgi:hypothetical protein
MENSLAEFHGEHTQTEYFRCCLLFENGHHGRFGSTFQGIKELGKKNILFLFFCGREVLVSEIKKRKERGRKK